MIMIWGSLWMVLAGLSILIYTYSSDLWLLAAGIMYGIISLYFYYISYREAQKSKGW